MSVINALNKCNLVVVPEIARFTHYEVMMGSIAYGVSEDTSDVDIYAVCIPPKEVIFPHLTGEILGFGRQKQRFDTWQQPHVKDPNTGKSYDLAIYNIIRYFHLCMENNPNMIDSLFVPVNCICHCTNVGNLIRENRKIFLHKGCWHRFKGYSYSQLHKAEIKNPELGSKRYETVKKFGYDVKFAYHVVRLLDEVEQILSTGDIDLIRNKEQLKAIRRGEWTFEQVKDYFSNKEVQLETIYHKSNLPYGPNESRIKRLLLECLELHYGSLDKAIVKQDRYEEAIREITRIVTSIT